MLFLLLKLNFKIFIIVMNFKYLLYATQTTHSLVDPTFSLAEQRQDKT